VFRAGTGMLYLAGGSNGAAALHTVAGFAAAVDPAAWAARLRQRHAALAAAGSRFVQLIVPEKLAIHPLEPQDRRALFAVAEEPIPPGRRLMDQMPPGLASYPDRLLRQLSRQTQVYLPTDSHWTGEAAFAVFRALMTQLGHPPDPALLAALPRQELRYPGDLWEERFADLPVDTFVRLHPAASIRRVYANPLIGVKERDGLDNEAGLHAGSHCIFHNPAAPFDETVALFGSSFSDCRLAPSLLTAILAHYVTTVHFVWSTGIDVDYVARHRVGLTIAELPERFLTACPDDATPVEDFAAERLRQWRARAPR
jgi:hypothetical protein